MSDQVIVTAIVVGGIVTGVFIITVTVFVFNIVDSIRRGLWDK